MLGKIQGGEEAAWDGKPKFGGHVSFLPSHLLPPPLLLP